MKLDNLKQAPLNTTFMGVVRGVFDFYGIAASDSVLFGASGHGFALNIHKELCPSGPYCWNKEPVRLLLANLGVQMEYMGFYSTESSSEERHHVEGLVRLHLDSGHPCSLLNMENQLITGYDDVAFQVSQPWPCNDFPPKTLTFGTWQELGDEVHVDFYNFRSVGKRPSECAMEDSLRYAVESWRNPKAQTMPGYGFGPDAYDNWVDAIQSGFGATHGNWWNATVWGECRRQLSGYFQEISSNPTMRTLGSDLGVAYAEIADLLSGVSEKDRDSEDKVEKLKLARSVEELAVAKIEAYLNGAG